MESRDSEPDDFRRLLREQAARLPLVTVRHVRWLVVEYSRAVWPAMWMITREGARQRGNQTSKACSTTETPRHRGCTENGAAVYRRLLEEAALTLSINGDDALAKLAHYHAQSLADEDTPHENPFLRALTARSIFVLIALYAREQEEIERAKGAPGPAGIAEPESPGLIERV